MRARPCALLLVLALLPIAGCGGGDSDEDKVVEVIETSAASTDPADCTALQTQRFNEQATFEKGEAAVENCEAEAKVTSDDPDSVKVSEVEVDGERATATVESEGGSFDGQTVSVSLVDENGEWKLDRIEEFIEFDQDDFAAGFEESATRREEDPLSPREASCVAENFRNAPPDQIQEDILSGDLERILPYFQEC